jgi:uncharacterized membrane protein YtjA (UPF0391 family)
MGNLLHWAIVFLVIALIAAFLGFGGVLFWVAIILLVISFVGGLVRRG